MKFIKFLDGSIAFVQLKDDITQSSAEQRYYIKACHRKSVFKNLDKVTVSNACSWVSSSSILFIHLSISKDNRGAIAHVLGIISAVALTDHVD